MPGFPLRSDRDCVLQDKRATKLTGEVIPNRSSERSFGSILRLVLVSYSDQSDGMLLVHVEEN
ncbi:hypothetical protein Q31a_52160 [Aureliella helgolandensis]|uniref:Uncharacterized protein n=1 Tax=Aureliella helgolandensis TaxID=2527968 RepID=A0A518GE53_9BACT|nr:hypothetical protein Q31a_52160 [Aureliella helgolandensis]